MSIFAIVDGIELCKVRAFSEPDPLIADEGRTANGSFRRDVTAVGRSWEVTLGRLTGDEFAILQRHFLTHVGRSMFWYRGFGGSYDTDARPVVVRASYRHEPGIGIRESGRRKPYLRAETGAIIITEDGKRIALDTLQPWIGTDFLAGEIRLTITQVHGGVPGGGWVNTAGSEVVMIPGPEGADGPSAYQVAVEQGFTGTTAEWLASLEGPVGPVGPQGTIITAGPTPPSEARPGDLHIDDSGDVLEWEE